MNTQNTPQTTTESTDSFYKTLLALRNVFPPEDDLGIPSINVCVFLGCGVQVVNPFDNS